MAAVVAAVEEEEEVEDEVAKKEVGVVRAGKGRGRERRGSSRGK